MSVDAQELETEHVDQTIDPARRRRAPQLGFFSSLSANGQTPDNTKRRHRAATKRSGRFDVFLSVV